MYAHIQVRQDIAAACQIIRGYTFESLLRKLNCMRRVPPVGLKSNSPTAPPRARSIAPLQLVFVSFLQPLLNTGFSALLSRLVVAASLQALG